MSHISEIRGCNGDGGGRGPDGCGNALLPAAPFWAPRYHFGMLLGVDDFESEQAYHRGKTRLHNAWLHGEGVVWGFRVHAPPLENPPGALQGELRVEPGLALDAAGRELHLTGPACVNVGAWYAAHRDDPGMDAATEGDPDTGPITFTGHVVACFDACLARPVPAITEPCAGAGGGDVAYSRAQEGVELHIRPGPPPSRTDFYPRLRLLFGLAEPRPADGGGILEADQQVLDALNGTPTEDGILDQPLADQPAAYLAAFRRFAALDEMDRGPAAPTEDGGTTIFPAHDDTCVLLARVELTLERRNGDLVLTEAEVDNEVRPSHVATSTIQELLCGPLFRALAAPAPEEPAPGEEEPAPGEEEPTPGEEEPTPGEEEEPTPTEEEVPPAEDEENPPAEEEEEGTPPAPEEETTPGPEETPPGREDEQTRSGPRNARPAIPAPGPVLRPIPDRPVGDTEEADGDGGGPRIDPASVRLGGEFVEMRATAGLSKASVTPVAFSVSVYDLRNGWRPVEVRATSLADRAGTHLRLDLGADVGPNLVRVIARGTGVAPILGRTLLPLAGAVGGPPAGTDDGRDFVIMVKRSET